MWKPKGWAIETRGPNKRRHEGGNVRVKVRCDGSPVLEGIALSHREGERLAWKLLMQWLATPGVLDIGWTLHTANRVHLRIKGQPRALCGSRLQETGPPSGDGSADCENASGGNIPHETPECRRCNQAQRTIERTVGRTFEDIAASSAADEGG